MFRSLNSFLFIYLKCTCMCVFDWTYLFSLRWSSNYSLHNVFDWVSIQIGYWQLMRSLSVQTPVFCDLCSFLSLYMYDWKAIGEEIKLLAIPTHSWEIPQLKFENEKSGKSIIVEGTFFFILIFSTVFLVLSWNRKVILILNVVSSIKENGVY